MGATPRRYQLSEIQRLSWQFVQPFLAAHMAASLLLYVSYLAGFTRLGLGDSFCMVLDTLNPGTSDRNRAFATAYGAAKICQLYAPAAVINGVAALIVFGAITITNELRLTATRWSLARLFWSFFPLLVLLNDPSETATSSLSRSLREGTFAASVVFLVGNPLFTAMFAAGTLQKIYVKRRYGSA